ncbi:MAG TPA: AfsR/SARP family transcriptional regulator [Streptosporangiaceae bacterium]|nr:AfsR/SARP family transcriptional regulator [Streptosporangiaceae bacterium]
MNNASDFDTIVMDAADARRIAELEREVRQLRHVNEILKVHFAGEPDTMPDAVRDTVPDTVPDTAPDALRQVPLETPMDGPMDAPRAAWARPPRVPAVQPMAEFRVLGPIEATVDGQVVDLGAPKQRAMLALLVSRAGQPVPVDLIVEELWTGRPPPSAITSLQAYVANLRRVLEPDRAPRTPARVLCTRGKGYLLDSRVAVVDASRFGERAAAGWQALDRGDPQRALIAFEVGLALWRGQAYTEVADATYVAPEVARLEELRLSAIEGRCAALLAVGAHELAAAELEAFTQTHPLREYGYELLSLALYRSGRQADALAALRTNQQRLALELGIDPRPVLQRLEKEILNQAPALDWHPPLPAAASREPGHVRSRR